MPQLDIKPDNILVKFRDYSLIESEYLLEVPISQQAREETQYSPIPSQALRGFYFNDEDSTRINEFDIALGDWGMTSWTMRHPTEKIKPVALRSPEVLIEAPWDTATDWWNLGAVILEVFRAIRIFSGRVPPDGHHELKKHLAELLSYMAPFLPRFLRKEIRILLVACLIARDTLKTPNLCKDLVYYLKLGYVV